MKKLLVLLLGAFIAAAIAGPASAFTFPAHPPVWQATLDAKTGTDQDAPGFITTGACPTPARDLVGRMYGEGFPASGTNVIANTAAGVSKMVPFATGFQQSLRDTRVQQAHYQPYQGVYTIVVSCVVPAYPTRSFGDYVVKIRFTDATNWVQMPPVTRNVGPIRLPNGTYVPINSAAAAAFKKKLQKDPKLAQQESLAIQNNGVVKPPAKKVQAVAAVVHTSSSPWPGILLIGGGVIAAGGTIYFVRRKGRQA